MIIIKETDYIAEGLARKCYYHPNNANLCIKIGKPEVERKHLYKEINYYKKIKNKKISKFDYQFYAKYHGEIETNFGVGFVYDLIKDENTETISLTLRNYLMMKNAPFKDAVFKKAINRLKAQMIKHKVFVGDLRARNICCKVLKDNSIELVVVDGLGHRDFIPIADWFSVFARKKIERRFLKSSFCPLSKLRRLKE
ncbi:YrbL family protein [Algibacter sp. PT7-4]|uniref:YrbL family protein n=1 Tax=Algibacter ulvanivorans TaxID=3400999 RepID=UPI003AB0255D